jgi:hypothetical protein
MQLKMEMLPPASMEEMINEPILIKSHVKTILTVASNTSSQEREGRSIDQGAGHFTAPPNVKERHNHKPGKGHEIRHRQKFYTL